MAVNYTQSQSDPLLASSSTTSDYRPYIQAATQGATILSDAARRAGNTSASNYGLAQTQIGAGNASSANLNSPYTDLGLSATQRLQGLMTNPSSITMDPAYQFNLDQQMQQLQAKNAAGGKLLSGQNIDDIAKLTSGYASNAYQQQVQNNLAQAGLGQASAINQGNQNFQAGQAIGAYQGQIGDTLGNADVAAANAQARGLYDASRGLVAQSTVRSTPFGVDGSGQKDINVDNSGRTDGLPGATTFDEYTKNLASLNSNKNANAGGYSPSGAGADPGTPGTSSGGSSGGGGLGGTGGSSNLGGAAPTPSIGSGVQDAVSGAANAIGSAIGGSFSNPNNGGSAGSSDFGGSSGLSGSLGDPSTNGSLSSSGGNGILSGGLQSAVQAGAAGAVNTYAGYLPGESPAQYAIRQQRIWESRNPEAVAAAVKAGNRAPGSVYGA